MRTMEDIFSALDATMYRPESAWISEASARENAALTRALQISLSDTTTTTSSSSASADTLCSPLPLLNQQFTPPSSSSSSSSAAAAADAILRRRGALGPAPAGRVSKRKSRASKPSTTTYIDADPANFRELVQRVTGARLEGDPAEPQLMRPKLVRPAVGARADPQQICLPTLDTSAFLLDTGAVAVAVPSNDSPFGPPPVFDFDPRLPVFPTLESWAM
ncbi:VQ motif [Musa troglodytarum]|uniref:VQ motif n=1 Tax=Musa troglodytarum TaxID=320322 RepID=A0A9E7FVC1_9LILI|nr:VQ motif [Musa troglodytarum]